MDLAALFRRQMPRWELTRDAAFLERVKAQLATLEKTRKAVPESVTPVVVADAVPADKPPAKTAKKTTAKKTTKKKA